MTPQHAVRGVVIATVVALLAATAWALGRPAAGTVATNGVPPRELLTVLHPYKAVCDVLGRSGPRADALVTTIGLYGQPAQPLGLSVDGRRAKPVTHYRDGVVTLPLPPARRHGGRVACIENLGDHKVVFAGVKAPLGGAVLDGFRWGSSVSLRLVQRDRESWGARGGAIRTRVSDARGAPLGALTPAAVIALFALAVAGAGAATWRMRS